MLILLHILGGTSAIAGGILAICARKGSRLHRFSGTIFLVAMVVMTSTAFPLALYRGQGVNAAQALFTLYLVLTGYFAMAQNTARARLLSMAGACLVFGVAATEFYLALRPAGPGSGIPRFMMAAFASLGLLAFAGDVRRLRRPLSRAQSLMRHLWRMTFALWIACVSLFLGQPRMLPGLLTAAPVRAIAPVAILLVLAYWMVKMYRAQRSSQPA